MSENELPRTRQEGAAKMDAGLAGFMAVLGTLSDAQMLTPVDAAGWNVRDHVVHLAVWAEGVAALLRREDRWAAMGVEDPRGGPMDFEAWNAQIAAQQQHVTPAEARARLTAAHASLAAAMWALSDDDLQLPTGRFKPPFDSDKGSPIIELIAADTWEHYEEHLPWLPVGGGG